MTTTATTIREHIHDALHSAGPAGLSMTGLTGAVQGAWRSRDVEAVVRRLWEINELGRRHDGTFVLTGTKRPGGDARTRRGRAGRRELDAAVRRVANEAHRDGHSSKITMRTVDPALLRAYCAGCRAKVNPRLDGTCPACGHQTGANVERASKRRRPHRRKPLEKGQPGWGPTCRCGAPKSKQAHSCRACSRKRRRGRKLHVGANDRRQPKALTLELLEEARRLYLTGMSLNQVAARIHEQTTYKSVTSCSEGLYSLFRTRGWKLRPQREVTRARSTKHGRKARGLSNQKEVEYRHWLAEQRGWNAIQGPGRPTCKGVKNRPPNKGKPCERTAMADSEYCHSHDPRRALERQAQLARMRASSRYREPVVDAAPFAAWLAGLAEQLGGWREVGALIGADPSLALRWGTGQTRRVTVRVLERSAANAGTSVEAIYHRSDSGLAAAA